MPSPRPSRRRFVECAAHFWDANDSDSAQLFNLWNEQGAVDLSSMCRFRWGMTPAWRLLVTMTKRHCWRACGARAQVLLLLLPPSPLLHALTTCLPPHSATSPVPYRHT